MLRHCRVAEWDEDGQHNRLFSQRDQHRLIEQVAMKIQTSTVHVTMQLLQAPTVLEDIRLLLLGTFSLDVSWLVTCVTSATLGLRRLTVTRQVADFSTVVALWSTSAVAREMAYATTRVARLTRCTTTREACISIRIFRGCIGAVARDVAHLATLVACLCSGSRVGACGWTLARKMADGTAFVACLVAGGSAGARLGMGAVVGAVRGVGAVARDVPFLTAFVADCITCAVGGLRAGALLVAGLTA